MSKTIEPLGDRVLVEVLPLAEFSAGGVALPESSRERSQRGLVLGVGPGRFTEQGARIPVGIEQGDVVVFSKYGGTELPDAGVQSVEQKQLLILRESDVLGIERDSGEPAEDARMVARVAEGEEYSPVGEQA